MADSAFGRIPSGNIPGTSGAKFSPAPPTPRRGDYGRPPRDEQFRDIRGHYTGGFGVNWIGLDAIVRDTKNLMSDNDMEQRAQLLAQSIQAYAQENAPWEDRTSDARTGLTAEAIRARQEMSILLYHTVEYGVYLENANGGNYSIIIPTMEKFAAELETRMFGPGVKR